MSHMSDRLCILEPPTVLLRELLERFQMLHDFTLLKTGATTLIDKVCWSGKGLTLSNILP